MLLGWVYLSIAIASEVTATLSLRKAGDGSVPAIVGVTCGYVLAFSLLVLVVRRMDVSVAYAAWSGVGTAVVAAFSIAFFGESASPVRLASLALVIVGVVGLNLTGSH